MKKLICFVAACLILALVSCSQTVKNEPEGAGRVKNSSAVTETAGPDGTDKATGTAPSADPAPTGYASFSGSSAAGDLVYVRADGEKVSDFSFLDGKSREYVPDCGDPDTGSWYCGKTERDPETGEVRKIWDRSDETLGLLAKYGVIYRGDESRNVCYFTFDCDYEYGGNVAKILDTLKDKGVKALFVLNGTIIESRPDLVKRMIDEGHTVGNHGRNHKNMARLSVDEFIKEVEDNNALLREKIPGAPYMVWYRPPYGTVTEWDMALAERMGLKNALYSWTYDDYHDDAQPEPASAKEAILKGLHPGCVYMFHPKSTTDAAVMGEVIDAIRAAGYEIESVENIK
ncbi:MAG: polysaccharide deacetylase family protein [Clostridia bacterium]|nr:polysaccharide deacetylase family protein [Clostridia bacterium]